MAYIDFPDCEKGIKERKAFWLSEDGILLVSQWRKEGISIKDIAEQKIGVKSSTFWRWAKDSEDMHNAIMVAKATVDAKVENALLKRALGYDYDEETWDLVEGELRRTKVVRKHVAPDVKACLSYLYNQRSDRWRAIQEPVDSSLKEVETAKQILVAIKEVAEGTTEPALEVMDDGDTSGTQSETD